jgi:hypothetical protein
MFCKMEDFEKRNLREILDQMHGRLYQLKHALP